MNKTGRNRFSMLHKEHFQIFISSVLFPTYLEDIQINMVQTPLFEIDKHICTITRRKWFVSLKLKMFSIQRVQITSAGIILTWEKQQQLQIRNQALLFSQVHKGHNNSPRRFWRFIFCRSFLLAGYILIPKVTSGSGWLLVFSCVCSSQS